MDLISEESSCGGRGFRYVPFISFLRPRNLSRGLVEAKASLKMKQLDTINVHRILIARRPAGSRNNRTESPPVFYTNGGNNRDIAS